MPICRNTRNRAKTPESKPQTLDVQMPPSKSTIAALNLAGRFLVLHRAARDMPLLRSPGDVLCHEKGAANNAADQEAG